MTDINKLADRIEALEGPDREVDIAILTHPAFGYRDVHGDGSLYDRGNDGYWYTDDLDLRQLPSPTASLDDAMALVPEDGGFTLTTAPYEKALATIPSGDDRVDASHGYAATPALALAAAALRARGDDVA